jgi:hypothetical protein
MTLTIDPTAMDGALQRSLAQRIQALVTSIHPEVTVERRHDQRFAMPHLLSLTPLDANGEPLVDSATIVLGKDISRSGISFFHDRPLHYRRAIISLEQPEFGRFAAEIDIHWCRFTRPGWYVSGCRLVAEVAPDCVAPIPAANYHRGDTAVHAAPGANRTNGKAPRFA